MTPITAPQALKDQVFLSTTAWIFILLSATILYALGSKLLVSQQSVDLVAEALGESRNPEMVTHFAEMRWIQSQVLVFWGGIAVTALLLLASAILLLRRARWSRGIFTTACLIAVAEILAFVFWRRQQFVDMATKTSARGDGVSEVWGRMQDAALLQTKLGLVFFAIVAWALVRTLIRLNRKRMKQYFDGSY
ncbi:MAG: hypothetical protein AAGJ82_08305 [Bacteroidota bacterium]